MLAGCGRVRLSRVARDGVEPSEAGVIPALSRNGDAPAGDNHPGMSPDAWPVPTYCPRRKDGSSDTPAGVSRRPTLLRAYGG